MKFFLYPFLYTLRRLLFSGTKYECPVCRSKFNAFISMGTRLNARCPVCNSLERHRLIWLFCQRKTDLFDGRFKHFLHVAPEPFLRMAILNISDLSYIGADLLGKHTNEKMDVTDIKYGDNYFDVIFCSHVLEHVPDDVRAMRELFRVLKPGGWAILQVPILGDQTQEDLNIIDPKERTRLYGQEDHVRQYGKDYAEKLQRVGFRVNVDAFAQELSEYEQSRNGILLDEDIFFCRKAALL
jgi:SAM-dependent methyltransferase